MQTSMHSSPDITGGTVGDSSRPQFVDIHAHTNFAAYDADRDAAIRRALDAGVWMMNVGTQKDTSASAVALAGQYEQGVYATVAIHPVHTCASHCDEKEFGGAGGDTSAAKNFVTKGEVFDPAVYRALAADPKVVAIGECGLDYFHLDEQSLKTQKEVFVRHIELANELGKPLMLHIRDGAKMGAGNGFGANTSGTDAAVSGPVSAYADAYELLKRHAKVKGNVHFFAGTWQEAQKFFELGFTISFTGVITFAKEYAEVVRKAPLNMIHAETDCPYVTPAPYRGKRNEPAHVREVVKKIAEIREEDFERVRAQLVENAIRVFGLK